MDMTRPPGSPIPRSEVKVENKKTKSYKDFPDVCILKDETLDILKSGKKVTVRALMKYLNIKYDAAKSRLDRLQKVGLCSAEYMRVKDIRGRVNNIKVYYIKN